MNIEKINDPMTVNEVANLKGISGTRVNYLIQTGKLPAERRGNQFFIWRKDAIKIHVAKNFRKIKLEK